MKITLIIIFSMLLLAGGGYMGYRALHKDSSAAQTAGSAKVERGAVRAIVESTGKVVSNLDVDIKCKASGEVIKLPYDVSDHVAKDSLLVQLDPIDEQRLVEQSTATLAASEARLAQARQNLLVARELLVVSKERAQAGLESSQAKQRDAQTKAGRMKELLDKKLAAQEDFDTAQTAAAAADADLDTARAAVDDLKNQEMSIDVKKQDINLAQAQVDSDKVVLDDAQQRLAETKVTAPISGYVSALNVQIGTIISSGITNIGGGTTVLTLSDLSKIFVLASVDESDIGKIVLGQPVDVTADAYPGQKFAGTVVRIATKGVNVSNVVTFEVKIEVTGAGKNLLKPEMTANVAILTCDKDGVLLVPTQALLHQKGQVFVSVVGADGATQRQLVQTGAADDLNTEIISGLTEGQTVELQKFGTDSRWRGQGPPGPDK